MQPQQFRKDRIAGALRDLRTSALELEQFKQCLLGEHRSARDLHVYSWLNRAVDEAASIALGNSLPAAGVTSVVGRKTERRATQSGNAENHL